jgi:hypothetical protein
MGSLARQFLALLIAVVVTAGLSTSAIQANDMAIQMAIATDMGMQSEGGCSDCPDQNTDNGKTTACSQACVAPVLAIAPQFPVVMPFPPVPGAVAMQYSLLHGRDAGPDPYPPKTSSFI